MNAISSIYQGTKYAGITSEALAEALKEDDPAIISQAACAIGSIGDEKLFTTLKDVVYPSPTMAAKTREAAALAVTRTGDDKLLAALDKVVALPYSSKELTKKAAEWPIGKLGDVIAPEKLQGVGTETAVVWAIGRLGKKSVPLLIKMLSGKNNSLAVRRYSARVLGNMGEATDSWEPLTQVAHDSSSGYSLQLEAKQALANIDPQRKMQDALLA